MGKMVFEANCCLNDEPAEFKNVTAEGSRTVYIWENKRGCISETQPFIVHERRSIMEEEPTGGFLEIWEQTDDETIPPSVSDIWKENYKYLVMDKILTEWHPSQKLLRVVWSQTPQEQKVLRSAAQLIEKWNLAPLSFPRLQEDQQS